MSNLSLYQHPSRINVCQNPSQCSFSTDDYEKGIFAQVELRKKMQRPS